jgi:hypothetical protein
MCAVCATKPRTRSANPDGGCGGGGVKQAPRRLPDSFPSKLTAAKARDENIDSQGRKERKGKGYGEPRGRRKRRKRRRRKTNAIAKCCSYKIHVQSILHANISAIFFIHSCFVVLVGKNKIRHSRLTRYRLSLRWGWPAAACGLQESPRGPCACRRARRQGRPRACAQARPSCPRGHLAGCAEHA